MLSALFLRETLTVRILLALVLGLAAIAVLLSSDWERLQANPLGFAFLLAAAWGWAIGTILVKRVRWDVGMTALAGWQIVVGAIPVTVIALFSERFALHEGSLRAYIGAAHVVFLGLIVGYFLWFRVVALYPANIGSIGTLVIPVVGMASGHLPRRAGRLARDRRAPARARERGARHLRAAAARAAAGACHGARPVTITQERLARTAASPSEVSRVPDDEALSRTSASARCST